MRDAPVRYEKEITMTGSEMYHEQVSAAKHFKVT